MYDNPEALKKFQFKEPEENLAWESEIAKAWELLIIEMEPFLAQKYPDDANVLRERLCKIAEYTGRLAYRRARLAAFYQVAYSQAFVRNASLVGAKVDVAKQRAKRDAAPVAYLMNLAENFWESIRETKGTCQSILAMEREGAPRGSLYPHAESADGGR